MKNNIKIVGFDADDTLWINEPLYQEAEKHFCDLLKPYSPEPQTHKELYRTEMQNLELYGYGAKAFILSLIETALRVSENKVTNYNLNRIIEIGKDLLNQPIILLDNVEKVLRKLKPDYKLILATKGDLLDQERKLEKSGLADYFHHIEIMSDKQENNYLKLIHHLDIDPKEFVMIGNSIKSDILPVINIGAKAIHVPYEVTWIHENVPSNTDKTKYITVNNFAEVLNIL
jgi:putative hydrolase of the HAD superfamily